MESFDTAPRFQGALTTAHKAVAAFLSFVATYAGVLIADLTEAQGWISQLIVILGGVVGTVSTYQTRNKPKV